MTGALAMIAGTAVIGLILWWVISRPQVVYIRSGPVTQAGLRPARCRKCGRRLHRCWHTSGVSSCWDHPDGTHFHADGTPAEHR